jgi:type I restriction enzyme M protein
MAEEVAGSLDSEAAVATTETDSNGSTVGDGFILDFITGGRNLKETPKELVRQRIARALFHEYWYLR